jgi:PAS domain S-box-containing protein
VLEVMAASAGSDAAAVPGSLGIEVSTGDVAVLVRPVEARGRLAPLIAQVERIHGVAGVTVQDLDGADALLHVHLSRPVALASELRAALGQGMSACTVVDGRIEVELSGLVGRRHTAPGVRSGWRTGERHSVADAARSATPAGSGVRPAETGAAAAPASTALPLFPSLAHREAAATMIDALGSMSDVSILMYDADLRFQSAAGAQHARFGYSAEEVIGRPANEVLPPAAWPPLAPGFEAALAGRTMTIEFQSAPGAPLFEATYSPVYDGPTVVGGIVVSRDVTARRLTESLLRELTETFELTFDHSPIGQALLSPAGQWLRTNDAFCELLGRDEATLSGSTYADVTHPDDLEPEATRVREMAEGYRDGYDLRKRYLHADGHAVPAHVWVSLVRAGDGTPRGLITQVIDLAKLAPPPG